MYTKNRATLTYIWVTSICYVFWMRSRRWIWFRRSDESSIQTKYVRMNADDLTSESFYCHQLFLQTCPSFIVLSKIRYFIRPFNSNPPSGIQYQTRDESSLDISDLLLFPCDPSRLDRFKMTMGVLIPNCWSSFFQFAINSSDIDTAIPRTQL